jgi:glycosyltransferase involved in cell wall biosynthesis
MENQKSMGKLLSNFWRWRKIGFFKLRIGIVSLSSGQLGDAVRIDQFSKALKEMSFEVKLLNPYAELLPISAEHQNKKMRLTTVIPGLWEKISQFPGVKSYAVERLAYETLFYILSKKLYYMAKRKRIDILQAETLFAADVALPVKQALGLPMILDLHSGTFTEEIKNSVNPTEKFLHYCDIKQEKLILSSDHIIVTSQGMKDRLKANYGITKVSLAQNGATTWDGQRENYKIPIKVIYAGIFAYWERVQDYLDAAKFIGKGDFEFYLAGDGYLKNELLSKISKENIPVTYLGCLPREELREKMSGMHIGVAPMAIEDERKYCSSTKTYEYLSMGMPVVCANVGDWATMIKEKDCGIVVLPEDPVAIANGILAYKDKTLWKRHSANGKRQIIEQYSWEKIISNLRPVYEQLGKSQI